MERNAFELAIETNDLQKLQSAIDEDVDINVQNAEGNTALHLAISGSVGFEMLNALLMNGSSVLIKNNDGYTPLQLIDPQSSDTFLNLFRLEHYINYGDGVGNTIMHLMMMTDTADTQIWKTILKEFKNLKIDFNAQNQIGHTPLHIAATRVMGVEDLKFILSHFENVDLLLADKNGDTFLHTFLSNAMDDEYHLSFLTCLFEGKYKYWPKTVLKELVQSKNLTGHTPLHLCINASIINVDILRMFLQAGSEISSNNVYGENILHALVRCFPEEVELIECAVEYGDTVNGKNGFGETPLFFTDDKDVVQVLINAGADLNVKNKVGKTLLMAQMLKPQVNIDVVEMILLKGADPNIVDIHGNHVLHFAAWNGVEMDIVILLKQHGANIIPDRNGQLPCQIAQKRGHVQLLNCLCICEKGVISHSHQVVCQKETIRFPVLFEIKSDLTVFKCFQKHIRFFQASTISDSLSFPGIGSIMFHKEAEEVKNAVKDIINTICEEIGRKDQMLSNSIILSGSVGEDTKVGLPDEFDFICLLDRFSSICEVDEDSSKSDPGYVYVKLKPEFHKVDQYRHLFNQHSYLDAEHLRQRFLIVLMSVIQNPCMCCHANVITEISQFKESPLAPNCQFSLRWTSCEYKDIQINIDLVPACRIKGWWPPDTKLDGLKCNAEGVRNEGALMLLQTAVDEEFEPVTKLRVSALTAEKMHMKNFPQIARDVYMMSKILCDERICPRVDLCRNSESSFLKTYITSYMLKNCLFHIVEEDICECMKSENNSLGNKPQTLHGYVCKLFRKFQHFIDDEKLPAFIFPWQDIFTFQDIDCDIFPEQNHMKCACRSIYTKLILTLLGEAETFTDIDVSILDSSR